MSNPAPRPPVHRPRGAGGPFIGALIAGTVIGFLLHQPTIGFLAGLGIALAITALLWVGDRR